MSEFNVGTINARAERSPCGLNLCVCDDEGQGVFVNCGSEKELVELVDKLSDQLYIIRLEHDVELQERLAQRHAEEQRLQCEMEACF